MICPKTELYSTWKKCSFDIETERNKLMNVGELSQLISSIGFPIAMCVLMCYYIKYTQDNYRTDINNLNEKHKEESTKLVQAINNNTVVIKELSERLNKDEVNTNE